MAPPSLANELEEIFGKRGIISVLTIVSILTGYMLTSNIEEILIPLIENQFPAINKLNLRVKKQAPDGTVTTVDLPLNNSLVRFILWFLTVLLVVGFDVLFFWLITSKAGGDGGVDAGGSE